MPLVRSARTTHHPSVVSCDNITTVRGDAVHDTIGLCSSTIKNQISPWRSVTLSNSSYSDAPQGTKTSFPRT